MEKGKAMSDVLLLRRVGAELLRDETLTVLFIFFNRKNWQSSQLLIYANMTSWPMLLLKFEPCILNGYSLMVTDEDSDHLYQEFLAREKVHGENWRRKYHKNSTNGTIMKVFYSPDCSSEVTTAVMGSSQVWCNCECETRLLSERKSISKSSLIKFRVNTSGSFQQRQNPNWELFWNINKE